MSATIDYDDLPTELDPAPVLNDYAENKAIARKAAELIRQYYNTVANVRGGRKSIAAGAYYAASLVLPGEKVTQGKTADMFETSRATVRKHYQCILEPERVDEIFDKYNQPPKKEQSSEQRSRGANSDVTQLLMAELPPQGEVKQHDCPRCGSENGYIRVEDSRFACPDCGFYTTESRV